MPQRARASPILLNAIFALSARHLGQIQKNQQYAMLADNYNAACLRDLRQQVGSESTENLFAAAIILQVVEEINLNGMSEAQLTPKH